MNLREQSKRVPEVRYNDIAIGDQAIVTKTITEEVIDAFATLTGDVNPMHVDETFASTTMFQKRIAHGMLIASFISTVLGTKLPGKNTIYLSQHVAFKAPVAIGDTIRVVAEVIKKRDDKKIITLQTNIYNQQNQMVVEGTAAIMKME